MGQKVSSWPLAVFPLGVILFCTASCAGGVGLTSSFCDPRSGMEAIRLTPAERAALAPEPKRNILAVNNYGARNCGWKP